MSTFPVVTTYPVWDVQAACNLASFAHSGQTDKAGMPYINHPRRVAERVAQYPGLISQGRGAWDIAVMAAWLHDVVEDTRFGLSTLYDLGCPVEVIEAVNLLTRPSARTQSGNARYYARIKEHPLALIVKECDIADNTDPARLERLDEATRTRLERKYAKAREALGLEVKP